MTIRYGHTLSKLALASLVCWTGCLILQIVGHKNLGFIALYAALVLLELINERTRTSIKALWFRTINLRRQKLRFSFKRGAMGEKLSGRLNVRTVQTSYVEWLRTVTNASYVEVAPTAYSDDVLATAWFPTTADAVAFRLRYSDDEIEFAE